LSGWGKSGGLTMSSWLARPIRKSAVFCPIDAPVDGLGTGLTGDHPVSAQFGILNRDVEGLGLSQEQ